MLPHGTQTSFFKNSSWPIQCSIFLFLIKELIRLQSLLFLMITLQLIALPIQGYSQVSLTGSNGAFFHVPHIYRRHFHYTLWLLGSPILSLLAPEGTEVPKWRPLYLTGAGSSQWTKVLFPEEKPQALQWDFSFLHQLFCQCRWENFLIWLFSMEDRIQKMGTWRIASSESGLLQSYPPPGLVPSSVLPFLPTSHCYLELLPGFGWHCFASAPYSLM